MVMQDAWGYDGFLGQRRMLGWYGMLGAVKDARGGTG